MTATAHHPGFPCPARRKRGACDSEHDKAQGQCARFAFGGHHEGQQADARGERRQGKDFQQHGRDPVM
jgi:hypothetical protein